MVSARRRQAGFTLIELMIVVAIISVLAVVAMNSYHKHMDNVRKTEVMSVFADIRTKEEAYKTEFNTYLTLSASEDDFFPVLLGAGEPAAKDWTVGTPATWAQLGIAPGKQQLYCGYSVMAAPTPAVAPAGARGAAMIQNPTQAWWYATGTCDNDGQPATNALFTVSSENTTFGEQNVHN